MDHDCHYRPFVLNVGMAGEYVLGVGLSVPKECSLASVVRVKKLYNSQEELKERILKGLPLQRRIFDYERIFKKGDLVRIKYDGIADNYTYIRREKGMYVFRLGREPTQFDDGDFNSNFQIVWVLRGKDTFLSDEDIQK